MYKYFCRCNSLLTSHFQQRMRPSLAQNAATTYTTSSAGYFRSCSHVAFSGATAAVAPNRTLYCWPLSRPSKSFDKVSKLKLLTPSARSVTYRLYHYCHKDKQYFSFLQNIFLFFLLSNFWKLSRFHCLCQTIKNRTRQDLQHVRDLHLNRNIWQYHENYSHTVFWISTDAGRLKQLYAFLLAYSTCQGTHAGKRLASTSVMRFSLPTNARICISCFLSTWTITLFYFSCSDGFAGLAFLALTPNCSVLLFALFSTESSPRVADSELSCPHVIVCGIRRFAYNDRRLGAAAADTASEAGYCRRCAKPLVVGWHHYFT